MLKHFEEPILVTRPFLPALEEFQRGCAEIWKNQWLTNNGPMLQRFHRELAQELKVPESNLALFNNGTLALELGYDALGLGGGEVVTTPFTFVATSHALKRIGAKPVFADIDPETLCLSPEAAERAITARTKAIVPVHVYGNVCDVEGFRKLGEKYGVAILYDAAHAFGVMRNGRTVAAEGAMSMFSFHPTKLFHSCEGGCLVFQDAGVQERLFQLRNFAIKNETTCVGVGSNAKMNELQALMGLCCLRRLPELLEWRRRISEVYEEAFRGTKVRYLGTRSANHAYCPVLLPDEATREKVYNELKGACNVYARRYFYPLLTDFEPYADGRGTCPVAQDVSARVLTLPTYAGLALEDVRAVAENVLEIVG